MADARRSAMTRVMVWTGFWTFILDQASKWFVVHWLDLRSRLEIEVWAPFVSFHMAWNEGINFGLFAGYDMRWVLIAVALAISTFVALWIRREGGGRWTHASAGLLIGGALGNVIDRLLYGAVADFLNLSCCGIENPYAFNIADIAVFAGALGLVVFAGDGRPRRPSTRSAAGRPATTRAASRPARAPTEGTRAAPDSKTP